MEPWQFSPSSLNLLEQCLRTAKFYPPKDVEKKWVSLFKPCILTHAEKIEEKMEVSIEISDEEDNSGDLPPVSPGKSDGVAQANDDGILPLPPPLANLSDEESILAYFFDGSNSDESLVKEFYLQFLPTYVAQLSVKEPVSAVDLLIEIHRKHSLPFRTTIVTLFLNPDMSSNVLKEFLLTVKNNECTQFLQQLAAADMSKDAFIHHLNTLKYLYEKSEKSVEIQNFVFQCLSKSAEDCSSNMEYGRFMHMFFRNMANFELSFTKDALERLVNVHQTSFKITCSNICKSLHS